LSILTLLRQWRKPAGFNGCEEHRLFSIGAESEAFLGRVLMSGESESAQYLASYNM
jgi:hypothetical protein